MLITLFDFNTKLNDRFQKTANSVGALRYIRYLGGAAPDVGRMMSGVTTRYFTNPTDKGYRMRPDALSVVMIFTSGRFGN